LDQELIAFLEERFHESAQHTTQQIAALRQETVERFRESAQHTTQQIAALHQETVERFEKVESSIRETQVMIEDLRDQNQILAEGVSGVEEKLQTFREEVNVRFDQAQKTTVLYYTDLDRRLRTVEQKPEREGPRF
jgi:hypothetical protein